MSHEVFPVINFALLLVLLATWFVAWLVMVRRSVSTSWLAEHVLALTLRVDTLERTSPCAHCRRHHFDGDGGDEGVAHQ